MANKLWEDLYPERRARILAYIAEWPGYTKTEIGVETGIPPTSMHKYLQILIKEGIVHKEIIHKWGEWGRPRTEYSLVEGV